LRLKAKPKAKRDVGIVGSGFWVLSSGFWAQGFGLAHRLPAVFVTGQYGRFRRA